MGLPVADGPLEWARREPPDGCAALTGSTNTGTAMMPTGDESPLQPAGRPAPWTVETPAWPPSVAQLVEPLPEEDPAAPEQPRRRLPKVPWRRFAVAGLVLIAVGLLVGGFVVGWVTHAALGSSDGDTTVEVVQAPDDADALDTALPDVRGLAVVDARQAIADVGLEATSIKAVDAPSALAEGTVVGQDPIGGTTGAGAVTLFVAVPGKVPDLVGKPSDEADRALTELGVRIERKQVYDPGVDEGTVTKLDPPAGKALPLVVTVTVAGPASSLYLAELQSLEGGCSAQETSIDGQDYLHALTCSPYYGGEPQVTTYLLDRRTSSIEGVIGVTDQSDPGYGAAASIVGDGKTLWSGTLRYGTGTPFTAKTSGVLRLEIRYRATSEEASGSFALGDARAVGSPDDITALGAE
jgi:hypothetical protein